MAAPEALSIPGENPPAGAAPAAVPASSAVWPRWPQLIPIAQLVAVVLGVFAIIWNQQQTTDSLRTELQTQITGVETELRAEITGLETELRSEITGLENRLRAEIVRVEEELRAEIIRVEDELRAEIVRVEDELRAEIADVRVQVTENGQRLARIEGFLGIGTPDPAPEEPEHAAADDRGPGG